MFQNTVKRGFTLIEILLVVAAIAILASIVIIAINPNKQLGDTRNATRRVDVKTILDAAYQYSLDSKGNLPGTITGVPTEICKTGGNCAGLIDLAVLTNNEKYLTSIPVDPSSVSVNGTNYQISITANNRVTVSAPNAEQGAIISATR
jgi:prepilin-type N-terminal cleavage/methylation domain-containing protein